MRAPILVTYQRVQRASQSTKHPGLSHSSALFLLKLCQLPGRRARGLQPQCSSRALLPSPTGSHPHRPLTRPGCPPVSLGCRTTSASKPTTVSRPLESADTAYMVVSLEKTNNAGTEVTTGAGRGTFQQCTSSVGTVLSSFPSYTVNSWQVGTTVDTGCAWRKRHAQREGREPAEVSSSAGSLHGEPFHPAV